MPLAGHEALARTVERWGHELSVGQAHTPRGPMQDVKPAQEHVRLRIGGVRCVGVTTP